MPREFLRADRVADAIQRSLAQAIRLEIQDPRVGMVNINSVSVTKDLAFAKVYVTLIGIDSGEEVKSSVAVLNKAANFLRNTISKDLTMRSTPKLQFYYDETSVVGQKLSNLIDKAVASDKASRPNDEE